MAHNVLQKTSGLRTALVYFPDVPDSQSGDAPFPKNDSYSLPPVSYDQQTGGYEVAGKHFQTHEALSGYIMSSLWVQQGGVGYGYQQGFFVFEIGMASDANFVNSTSDISDSGTNPYLAAAQSGQPVMAISAGPYRDVVNSTKYSSPVQLGYRRPTGAGIDMTNFAQRLREYKEANPIMNPVTYSSPVQLGYRAPTGSGIDMTNTGEKLASYKIEDTSRDPAMYSSAVQVASRHPTGYGVDMSNTDERLQSYIATQFNKSSLFTI